MTATVINLRQAKKQAARKAARATGDAQAAKFGQTRAERLLAQTRADKAARDLDAHKRQE